MGTSVIKISSWNVNGLGSYVKRQRVLSYLKQRNSDVVMLQETSLGKILLGFTTNGLAGPIITLSNKKSREYLFYFQKK